MSSSIRCFLHASLSLSQSTCMYQSASRRLSRYTALVSFNDTEAFNDTNRETSRETRDGPPSSYKWNQRQNNMKFSAIWLSRLRPPPSFLILSLLPIIGRYGVLFWSQQQDDMVRYGCSMYDRSILLGHQDVSVRYTV